MNTYPAHHRIVRRIASGLALFFILCLPARAVIHGSFIQLKRGDEEKTVEAWRLDARAIKQLGGDTLIIQWSAVAPVRFFHGNAHPLPHLTEVYPVIDRILDAADAENMNVFIGLEHHPDFWTQITGRDRVVTDFFRVIVARNRLLQAALLEAFGERKAWVGYYLPEEIDDLSWRPPERKGILHQHLAQQVNHLRKQDPGRLIAISGFFRARSSPEHLAHNMMELLEGTGVDLFLAQDGAGVGDPPLHYLPAYYQYLHSTWTEARDPAQGLLPELAFVVEAFEQQSAPQEPFFAVPAPPERLLRQMEAARAHAVRIFLFTYSDYLDPDRGQAARDALNALRPHTGTRATPPP